MRRLLFAASVAMILTGCDLDRITGFDNGEGEGSNVDTQWYFPVRLQPSGSGILSIDDNSQVEDLLQSIWTKQQSTAGIQEMMEWAASMAGWQEKPDFLEFEVSVIIVPDEGRIRNDPDPDAAMLTAFMDALEVEGLFYRMQGDEIKVDEPYNLTTRDGVEMPVTLRVREYLLENYVPSG